MVEAARVRVGGADSFRFCAEPSCEVAYFRPEAGIRILRSEVRVRIGQKESEVLRPICYCFEHTVEAIEAEVAASGVSTVADQIAAKCRQGLDRCEEMNPEGACCLGRVRRAIEEAQARTACRAASAAPDPCLGRLEGAAIRRLGRPGGRRAPAYRRAVREFLASRRAVSDAGACGTRACRASAYTTG